MISVVVADHEIVRRGIAAVFRSETDLRIVGETADGVEALRLVERLRPDVLVVDGQLPGVNGFEVARQALRASKKTRIVIIGMQQHEAYVRRALKTGALGYVLKSMRPRDIVDAVRHVAAGRRYLSAPLADLAIGAYLEKRDESDEKFDSLTTRERQVLALGASGSTNAEIAERLCISIRTVESHRANFIRKLGLRSKSDLVIFAIRHGLIEID